MKLSKLFPGLIFRNDVEVMGVQEDSRLVKNGDIFVARVGEHFDGRKFVSAAIERGAVAILEESESDSVRVNYVGEIPVILVRDLVNQIGNFASRVYGDPSRQMKVIGVTGTNGKTSITHFLRQALNECNIKTGLIGTLGFGVDGLTPLRRTTPMAAELQTNLSSLRDDGAMAVAMEVSSHSLVQGRVNGVNFDVAIFTNLTREHLDYHKTMKEYGDAKKRLFDWPGVKHAIINIDDEFGKSLASKATVSDIITYSIADSSASVFAKNYKCSQSGIELQVVTPKGEICFSVPILAKFNVSNILSVIATLLTFDLCLDDIEKSLSRLRSVSGRMQIVIENSLPLVVIDYAHTPDALEQVLYSVKSHCNGKLWCLFGCGGDRDRGKRALMGESATKVADRVVLTDDNPRFESPEQIISDILQGCDKSKVDIFHDRAEGIRFILNNAAKEDVILLAGKGHETYQIYGDKKIEFSDQNYVKKFVKGQ